MKYVSPGAYFREMDFSLYVPNLSTTICGMVGTATKGPVNEPTLVTNVPQFIQKFGNPSPNHYMPYAAMEYLRRGKILMVVRVVGTEAVAATATIDAVSPALIASTATVFPIVIDATNMTLRVKLVDTRTNPVKSFDASVALTANSYASHLEIAAEIASRLRRNPVLSELVTAIVFEDKLTLVAFEASTQVSIEVATTLNSADTILGLETGTPASGLAAGTFELIAASPGTHGNFVNVVMTPKKDFTFDITLFEGTPVHTAGYRTESHVSVVLDDSNTAKWIGTVLGAEATAGASATLQLGDDTLASDLKLVVPVRGTTRLTGGTDGDASVIAADFIGTNIGTKTGMQIFRSAEAIDINILCVPGVSTPSVINEMLALCEERGDAIAIIDTPDEYDPQQVVDWHNGVGAFADHQGFNSSYGAMYWPWVQIYDSYNGIDVYVPPSGHVAAVYAYTDFAAETWFAPAGFNRAHLVAATKVRYNADHGEREYMYGNGNRINPIVQFPKDGITIWGQKTLQVAPTARDRVNVRRLLLYMRKVISTAVKYLIFEPNDEATWGQFVRMIRPFMESIKSRRGVYEYAIICDETTNTPDLIDNSTMAGRIYIQPTKAAEKINVDFVLTPTGAKFEDYKNLIY